MTYLMTYDDEIVLSLNDALNDALNDDNIYVALSQTCCTDLFLLHCLISGISDYLTRFSVFLCGLLDYQGSCRWVACL